MHKTGGLRRWELGAMVAILLAAAALRLIALDNVPPGLRYDELLNYRMAQRVLTGEFPIYFLESWGHEPLFHYAQAASIALTKACDWSLRLPAALFGLSGVLTTWLVARRLFGSRVAVLAAAGLAVSFWSVFYSRDGLRGITIVPFSCLVVYFLQRGIDRSSPPDFVLSGVCLGGMFYTYMAARAFPLLPAVFALYLFLFHRPDFKRAWGGLLVVIILGGLLAAPLLYVVYGRPIFEPLAAACFVVGVVDCVRRWRRMRCALLFLWLSVSIVPAMIAEPPASISHAIAAQSPAYILLALGLDALWRVFAKRKRWIAPLLAAATIAFHGAPSCHAYFVTWANAPEVCGLHQCGVTAIARELDAGDPVGPVAVGAPYVDYWHPWNAVGFDLTLRREDLAVRWFNPAGGWV